MKAAVATLDKSESVERPDDVIQPIDISVDAVRPSPENDKIYGPIDPGRADFQRLLASVRQEGRVLVPIDEVLDIEAFNHEVDLEAKDAAFLDGVRRHVHKQLAGINFDQVEGG